MMPVLTQEEISVAQFTIGRLRISIQAASQNHELSIVLTLAYNVSSVR